MSGTPPGWDTLGQSEVAVLARVHMRAAQHEIARLTADRDMAREWVAAQMIAHGIATGHGETVQDLVATLLHEVIRGQRALALLEQAWWMGRLSATAQGLEPPNATGPRLRARCKQDIDALLSEEDRCPAEGDAMSEPMTVVCADCRQTFVITEGFRCMTCSREPTAAREHAEKIWQDYVRVMAGRDRALALLRKTRTHAPLGTHRWATLLAEIDAFLGDR